MCTALIPVAMHYLVDDEASGQAAPASATTASATTPSASADPVAAPPEPESSHAVPGTGRVSAPVRPATSAITPSAVVEAPLGTVADGATTVAVAPPPADPGGEAVRYRGSLTFGSYHLDLAQPRDIEGMNVWPTHRDVLHGDPDYQLVQWLDDALPGRADCAGYLFDHARKDADSLIVGSRVCGRTPGGRIFRIEILGFGENNRITGHVTVWE
ncbi:hypothetical protein ACQPZF_41350 [Actinosynnema sp. CS-041913]|uniref:hypothetical protein n=1 Tax=Actinosynnema sp. CS-041913 TaxID=3239917 RepID=UPI003D8CB941